MKLIVGLGNPGKEYENTRHNIGFHFIDYYLNKKKLEVKWQKKFDGLIYETIINNEKVLFLKPQTFMNLSGNSVQKVVNYFHISLDDIIVISDDMDLMVGNYKLRLNGSSGGHNGLKSIGECLGSFDFKRLKIGISKVLDMDSKDYVLGSLSKEEKKKIESLYLVLCDVLDDYFVLPFSDLMSKYNRKNR